MEMKYIVGLIIALVVILVGLLLIGKNTGIMSGLVDSLKSIFGL